MKILGVSYFNSLSLVGETSSVQGFKRAWGGEGGLLNCI